MDYGVKYGRYEQVNGEVVNRLNKEIKLLSKKLLELSWRPIKTAPKDETTVDIWSVSRGRCTNMQWTDLGRGNIFYTAVNSGPACVRDATHWMPVPEAPDKDIMEYIDAVRQMEEHRWRIIKTMEE